MTLTMTQEKPEASADKPKKSIPVEVSHIGKNVKRLREQKKISQMHLATAVNMTISGIQQLEKGTVKDCRASTLWLLAKALEVEIIDLYKEPPVESA